MEQVCLSVTQANNGYLPDKPTFGIGQPTALDPSRAPEGGWILWIQMQELPRVLKGDSAGEISVPDDGVGMSSARGCCRSNSTAFRAGNARLSNLIVGRRNFSRRPRKL